MKIILASSSKNRLALFQKLGIDFEVIWPTYEEKINPDLSPQKQVENFALEKARSVYSQFAKKEDIIIIGFDSMIDFEGRSIGKPNTKKEAFEMIQSFVGKSQSIVTGISMVGKYKGTCFEISKMQNTYIKFRTDTTNCLIRKYLAFEDWKGKCGAYSVLGTGIFFLEPIEGDFQNIVGVPIQLMGEMIKSVTGKAPLNIFDMRKERFEV